MNDFNLFELFNFNPEEGTIRIKGHRMLIFTADAMGFLRKRLIDILGEKMVRGIFTRFGFTSGYHQGLAMKELFKGSTIEDLLKNGQSLHIQEGVGNILNLNIDFTFKDRNFLAECIYTHSYEVEQHNLHIGGSTIPVCWTMTGWASGYCSGVTGEKIYFIEDECIGKGDKRCHVIGKPFKEWDKRIESHLEYFKTINTDREIVRINRKIILKAEELRKKEKKLEKLEEMIREKGKYENIIGNNKEIKKVFCLINRIADSEISVVIEGESGVGKELIARAIHTNSFRANKKFVALNCGALPETLLESELFGHAKGSFTGADKDKKGLFEEAEGGTIFLDEISETSPSFQVKLLRALEEKEVRRIGTNIPIKINVRVLSATNSNLEELINNEKFRSDLYYRLNGIKLHIPPLRNRKEDIIPLVKYFIGICKDADKLVDISSEAKVLLLKYNWPGNIRELKNVIQRALALMDNNFIDVDDLPDEIKHGKSYLELEEDIPLIELEKRYILRTLDKYKGNKIQTARSLNIAPNTLWRKLKSYPETDHKFFAQL